MAKRTDQASKRIAAAAERIYQALSNPEELAPWLPPKGMSGRLERYDFREDGGYRMILTYDAPTEGTSGRPRLTATLSMCGLQQSSPIAESSKSSTSNPMIPPFRAR